MVLCGACVRLACTPLALTGSFARYGIAPDHPEAKLVSAKFATEVLDDPAVRLFGLVEVGPPRAGASTVALQELRSHYDAGERASDVLCCC